MEAPIVGWQLSRNLRTDLALDTLEMSLWSRCRTGRDASGLIHYSNKGGATVGSDDSAQAAGVAVWVLIISNSMGAACRERLKLMLKDARLVQQFAHDLGVKVPGTEATVSTIDRAVESGWGEENASALIKVLAADAMVDLAR